MTDQNSCYFPDQGSFSHMGRALSDTVSGHEKEGGKGGYAGRFIIFLDVDGVLNCASTRDMLDGFVGIDQSKVALLREIVSYFDAVIVLSSSWKRGWHKTGKSFQDLFAQELDKRLAMEGLVIADKTRDRGRNRGEGILQWISRYGPVSGYLILDDERFDYAELGIGKHWLQTSFSFGGGLSIKHIAYIKKHSHLFFL